MPRFRFFTQTSVCTEAVLADDTSQGTALVLLGFPATIGENPLTSLLAKSGYVVAQPHYPGTYDSAGAFSPKTATAGVDAVLEEINEGRVIDIKSETVRTIPSTVRTLVGYSFGAHIAFRALHRFAQLDHLLLVSPAICYGDDETGFDSEDLSFLDYLRRSRPHTYRLAEDESWRALFEGRHNQFAQSDRSFDVLSIVGANDSSIDANIYRQGLKSVLNRVAPSARIVDTVVAPAGGHSVGTLLDEGTTEKIRTFLSSK